MRKTEYLIIGQGIAGTILSYRLKKAGIGFKVIDRPQLSRSSRIAAGLANPVVLKRQKWVKGAELFREKLSEFYLSMEEDLGVNFYHPLPLYHIFQSNGEINDWQQNASKAYLQSHLGSVENHKIDHINSPFGLGKVEGIFWVDTDLMIQSWREVLKAEKLLIEDTFQPHDFSDYIHIYSSGHLLSEHFPALQKVFSKTKGQVMIIESADLNPNYGLHSSVFTLPLGAERYKVGATYEHHNLNDETSEAGLERLQKDLEKFFGGDYQVVEQLAGVRPNIKDRQPLLGRLSENSYCFNGLGSRGILMAPYLSQHFIDYLLKDKQLEPSWDVNRFGYL